MDLGLFLQWAGAAGLVLGIVNTMWTMVGRGTKPFNDRLEKHSSDLKDHDRRLQKVENDQQHAPTGEQVTNLRLTVVALDAHVKSLGESMAGLTHTVRSMDQFLRSEKA